MKPTSRHNVEGQRCKLLCDIWSGEYGLLPKGSIVTIREARSRIPIVRAEDDKTYCINIGALKPIKPRKQPAEDTAADCSTDAMRVALVDVINAYDPPVEAPEPDAFAVGDWVEYVIPKGREESARREAGDVGQVTKLTDTAALVRWRDGYHGTVGNAREFLRRCAEPASTVPAGCPVDQQCHDEMTAAGWKWYEDGHYHLKRADTSFGMRPTSPIHGEPRWVAGAIALAAWRERSAK